MRRLLAVVCLAVLMAGCGSTEQKASPDIPAVKESRVPIDAALTDAGVDARLVQSLSETAQSRRTTATRAPSPPGARRRTWHRSH